MYFFWMDWILFIVCFIIIHITFGFFMGWIFYLNKSQTWKILTFIPYLSSLLITPNNLILLLDICKTLDVLIWKSYYSFAVIADYSSKIWSIFFYELPTQSIVSDINIYTTIFIGSSYTWAFYNKSILLI